MPAKNEDLCCVSGCRNIRSLAYVVDGTELPLCENCFGDYCDGLLILQGKQFLYRDKRRNKGRKKKATRRKK